MSFRKKSKSRASISYMSDNNNISLNAIIENFKDNKIDFNILLSIYKLKNKRLEENNRNIYLNRIYDNIKKKNIFYYFTSLYHINDSLLKKIIPHLKYEFHKKNTHIYKESEFNLKLFFVLKGFISFHKNEIVIDSEKNTAIMDVEKYVLGPEKYFGHKDIIYEKKNSLSAFCKTDVYLISLEREYFDKYLADKIIKVEFDIKFFVMKFLKNFSSIPSVRLEKIILNNVKYFFFKRNKVIYKEGEKNNGIYLIYKGESIIVKNIKKGEFFFLKNFNERIKNLQKRAMGVDYRDIIKNTKTKLNNTKSNDKEEDLNILLNKKEYQIISKMNKGAIGGLEITMGINLLKYSLISNSDFCCILFIELKNFEEYLTEFLINLIPVFVKFEKSIHERIKNMKLIDENITPNSCKKLKTKKKNEFFLDKEEENDKIYKKNIKKIEDKFQLNYGGFIKMNDFNFSLYQKREHFKDLLKQNKKKIIEINNFLRKLDIEEKSNLKYSEFKMNNNEKINLKSYNSCKNYNNLKINVDMNIDINKKLVNLKKKSKKNKIKKLYWKFYDTETKIKKYENNNNNKINTLSINILNDLEKKSEKKLTTLQYEKRSLSIDDDNYKRKIYICSPKIGENKRYKTKEIFFLTPKKNEEFNINKSAKKLLKNKNIKIFKKILFYDTGKFEIPLLCKEF